MKYHRFVLFMMILLLLLSASCKAEDTETSIPAQGSSALSDKRDESKDESHVDVPESSSAVDLWVPPESSEDIPAAEVEAEEVRFKNLISSLDSQKITKVEILRSEPPGSFNEASYPSTDPKVIERWINLLQKMEISGKAFQGVSGNGYSLVLYEGSKEISFGGFMLPYIYSSPIGADGHTPRTMCYVDNYESLSGEIEQVEQLLFQSN